MTKTIKAKLAGKSYDLALRVGNTMKEVSAIEINLLMAQIANPMEQIAQIGARLARPDTILRGDVVNPIAYAVAIDYGADDAKKVLAHLNTSPLMNHYPLAVELVGAFVFGATKAEADGAA